MSPLRFPNLRISLAEGGIGWVPMLLDRLDYVMAHSAQGAAIGGASAAPPGPEPRRGPPPISCSEALRRNFWFCTIDDPSTLPARHRIGVDHIMLECDYPHADSTWPDTQAVLASSFGRLDDAVLRKVAGGNAAALFDHPLPPVDDWRTPG